MTYTPATQMTTALAMRATQGVWRLPVSDRSFG